MSNGSLAAEIGRRRTFAIISTQMIARQAVTARDEFFTKCLVFWLSLHVAETTRDGTRHVETHWMCPCLCP